MFDQSELQPIFQDFQKGLSLNGLQRVVESKKELVGTDLEKQSDPEEYTKIKLIKPIIDLLQCTIDPGERRFAALRGTSRKIDYTLSTSNGTRILLEAKPLFADLDKNEERGCINEVLDAMKLHDVVSEFSLGIATDGYRWVFINTSRKIVADFNVDSDWPTIKDILLDKIVPEYDKENISKKFYAWYYALLYGGEYKNHDGKRVKIRPEDSLIESVLNVSDRTHRESIAQTLFDRLIFIKFLESKSIIKKGIIDYFRTLDDYMVNPQLKALFFNVMNVPVNERDSINAMFQDIPYLNGGLFRPTVAEATNSAFGGYSFKVKTLKEVFEFLCSFNFNNSSNEAVDSLDPEILGYIFEMSMVTDQRKQKGAFYTPREITTYMSDDAIHTIFIKRVREYLSANGYNESELSMIKSIEDVYGLRDLTLRGIFQEVLQKITICDNACGSGAFLLAAADTIFNIYYNVAHNAGIKITEIGLKNLILKQNIFGVDINPNAVEIAKLRLWLWVIDSYKTNIAETLPNIDYNLCSGNSLLGYTTIEQMNATPIPIDDYGTEKSMRELLTERSDLITKYKMSNTGNNKNLKPQIDALTSKISARLSNAFHREHIDDVECSPIDFFKLDPFHWGLAFYDVFEQGGFDIIVGNPPYVQLSSIKGAIHDYYGCISYQSYHKTGDLYCLFYERSNMILKNDGVLSYITSNKWMRNEYGQPLRNYFIEYASIRRIIDMADLQLFASATVECGIVSFFCRKKKTENDSCSVLCCTLSNESEIQSMSDYINANSNMTTFEKNKSWIIESNTCKSILSKMKEYGMPLKNWDVAIYRGILTGLNEAFIIDSETRDMLISKDPKSAEIIWPVLRGKDLKRYSFSNKTWIIVTHNGSKRKNIPRIDIINYPAIKTYLDSFYDKLEKRLDKGETPYNLRNCDYINEFDNPKIMWGEISDHTKFSIDVSGNNRLEATSFFMVGSHLYYLLGVLNSKFSEYAFSQIGTTTGMGTTRWKKYKIEMLCVPKVDEEKEKLIQNMVQQIISLKNENKDSSITEDELDKIIYSLYHLNDDEIKEIEQSVVR